MPLFITVVVRRCTPIVAVTMLNGLPEEVVNLVLDEMVDVGVTITDPGGRMCCCVSSVSLDPSAIGDTSVGSIIGGGTDAFLDCMIGNSTVLTLLLFITVVGSMYTPTVAFDTAEILAHFIKVTIVGGH